MAHECPECGQWCHCGGDIDDCGLNLDADIEQCTHCIDEMRADNKCDCCQWDGDCFTVCGGEP